MKPLIPNLTEKQFQTQVLTTAQWLGWNAYHTYDSRRSQPGFPDLVLVRDRVIYAELKAERGSLSAEQRQWREWLIEAGAEYYLWKPSHMDDIEQVLRQRNR